MLVICIELAGRKSEQELSARNALRSLRERESEARRSCCVCRAKPSGAGKRAVAKRAYALRSLRERMSELIKHQNLCKEKSCSLLLQLKIESYNKTL